MPGDTHTRSLKIAANTVASAMLVVNAALLLPSLFLLTMYASHPRQITSPDGKHVVVIAYVGQGAFGPDSANIRVRKAWGVTANPVYAGRARLDFDKETLRSASLSWLDNTRLVVRHGGKACHPEQAGEIHVVCAE